MLEVGDVVELNCVELISFFNYLPDFYTKNTFIIKDINDRNVVILDKSLNHGYDNLIHISFLKKSLKGEREKKIQKINA